MPSSDAATTPEPVEPPSEPVPAPQTHGMNRFLRVTMLLGSVTVLSLAVQIVRTKLMALQVGRAGMSLVAQFSDFQVLVGGFLLLGAEQGLIVIATDAYAHDNPAPLRKVMRLIYRRVVPLGLAILALLAAASPWILPAVTGQSRYVLPGALMLATLSAQLLIRPWQCVLNGAKAFHLLARARLFETLLSFTVLTPMVLLWHVEGALYAMALTNVVSLLVNAWIFRRLQAPVEGVRTPEDLADVAPLQLLLRFGTAALVTGFIGNGVGLLVRRRIIEHLGLDTSGLYQVAFSLTQQYLGLVLTAMAAYSFPSYRALQADLPRLREEVNHTLRGALLVIVPIIAVLLALRTVMIRVLFSADYLAAEQMLRVQLIGDFFKVIAWALGLTILATGRVRLHVILEIALGSTWLIGVESLTRWLGPIGPPLAFTANQILMCVVYFAVMRRTMNFSILAGNWRLILFSLTLLGLVNAATSLSLPVTLAATAVGLGIWARLCVQDHEVKGLMRYVRERVGRRAGSGGRT